MNLRSQKQIAARILKCGISRVRVKTEKEVGEAITREDIRNLVGKGLIWKVQKRGQARAMSRRRAIQKKRGRKRGFGSAKGRAGARNPRKRQWIRTIRAVRDSLRKLRETGAIEGRVYRRLYLMAKGGTFKGRRHLILYLREHELLKGKGKPAVKKTTERATKNTGKETARNVKKRPAPGKPIKKPAKNKAGKK